MTFQVQDKTPSYFSQALHIVDDLLTDPYEFRVYMKLKRYAGMKDHCWPSKEKLADLCGMSRRKLDSVLESLASPRAELGGMAMIEIIERKKEGTKENDTNLYIIQDLWPFNVQKYSTPCTTCTTPLHDVHHPPAPHAPKEYTKKKIQRTTTGAPAERGCFSFPSKEEIPTLYGILTETELKAVSEEVKALKPEQVESIAKLIADYLERNTPSSKVGLVKDALRNPGKWQAPVKKEDAADKNREIARQLLGKYDTRTVKGFSISVCHNFVEFSYGARNYLYHYDEPAFETKLKEMMTKLGL